ncbi:hypothetical protein C8R44DRAFT_201011 [Mycena epipterygia]|nr:hypothetical protein C8R44DRAFT_201011 [Mycena epipterygia]
MAPQKKGKGKKDANKSIVTLHNFFTSPGAGPSNKPAPPKSSKKSTTLPDSEAKRKPTQDPKEIIIIDSDSDIEVEVVHAAPKKRRRSQSSSDVELVQSAPRKRASAVAAAPLALSSTAAASSLSFGKPSALLASTSRPQSGVTSALSFGTPSALLGGPSLSTPLAFGKPTSLLDPRASLLDDGCSAVDVAMDFGADDEWGMGDDEMVVSPDEDDESTQIVESVVVHVSLCPLCEKALGQLSEAVRSHSLYSSSHSQRG